MEIKTSKEIEEKINQLWKNKEIKNQIMEKNMKFDIYKRMILDRNINPYNLENIKENEKHQLMCKLATDYQNFIYKKYDELIMNENGCEPIYFKDKKETKEVQERKIKHKKFKKIIKSPILYIGIAVVGTLGYYVLDSVEREKVVKRKTKEYRIELEEVVNGAKHEKYGNIDYNNGKAEQVSDEEASNDYISYVDYDKIAEYIENSDNPDLALFTLYREYGSNKGVPTYDRITNNTCERLTLFDTETNEIYQDQSFLDYIHMNGYDSYDSYYRKSKDELYEDSDDILDNITVKVKKLTY